MAEDLAALGVKDFRAPDWMREEEEAVAEFGVLAENWQAVNAFLACACQWHYSPPYSDGKVVVPARPTGLRYDALDIVLKHRHVDDPADCFERVRIMEAAALKEFARRR